MPVQIIQLTQARQIKSNKLSRANLKLFMLTSLDNVR